MTERVVSFGPHERLSGVLHTPQSVVDGLPDLLLFNAGVVHRIGPHRLNVKLARFLGARGARSLRFDLGGLGDSAPAPGGGGHEAEALADIHAAVDVLYTDENVRTRASGGVCMIGLCSGADNAYRAALRDSRITGLVLLDPYAYAGARARLERTARKAVDPDRWRRLVKRPGGVGETPQPTQLEGGGDGFSGGGADNDRPTPPRDIFGRDLQTLTRRGVRILILYTNYVEEQLTRPGHFFDVFRDFDFAGRLDVRVRRDVNHTYTSLKAQEALFADIAEWLAVGAAQKVTHEKAHGANAGAPVVMPTSAGGGRDVS